MIDQTNTNNLVKKFEIGADTQIDMIEKSILKQKNLQQQQPIPPILPIIKYELKDEWISKHYLVTYDCNSRARSLLTIFKDENYNIPKGELNKGLLEISKFLKSKNITHQNLTPSNLIVLDKKIYLNNFGSKSIIEKNFAQVTDPLNWIPYLNQKFKDIQKQESQQERENMIKSLTDAEIIAQEEFAITMMRAQLYVPIPKKNSPLTIQDSINYIRDWVEGEYQKQGDVDNDTFDDIKKNLNPITQSQRYVSSLHDIFFSRLQTKLVLKNQIPPLERQNLNQFLQFPQDLKPNPVWVYYLDYEELKKNQDIIARQKTIDQEKFKIFLKFSEELYRLLRQNSLPFSQFEEFYLQQDKQYLKYLCLKSLDQELQSQPYFKGWENRERKKLLQFYTEINDTQDIWKDIDMENRQEESIVFGNQFQLDNSSESVLQIIQPSPPSVVQPNIIYTLKQYSRDLKHESFYYFFQRQLLKAKVYYDYIDLDKQGSIQSIHSFYKEYLIIEGTIFIGKFSNKRFFGEIIRELKQIQKDQRQIKKNCLECLKNKKDDENIKKEQKKISRILHYESIQFEYDNEQNCVEFIREKINSSQFQKKLSSKSSEVILLERCFSQQEMESKNFPQLLWDKKFTKLYYYKGNMSEGKFKDDGEIITYNTNPVLKYTGEFLHGKKNGYGVLEVIDDCLQKGDYYRYEGNFKDDQYHDIKGKIYYDNQGLQIQVGKFKNGKNVGIHIYYHRDNNGNNLQKIVKYFIPMCWCTIKLQWKLRDD